MDVQPSADPMTDPDNNDQPPSPSPIFRPPRVTVEDASDDEDEDNVGQNDQSEDEGGSNDFDFSAVDWVGLADEVDILSAADRLNGEYERRVRDLGTSRLWLSLSKY
ncbi:hypothetical protein CYLTODRAFT_12111 [Cylindrobasidium torrendii FP15055 ss-10]|uniref:Uncharacterized protein n=1 Tax=Cylindrobasidium torrendii FP15055 ss-10 TaxID=1314674 RepID=A0A0D7AQI6_9AGAR|nr:hypothetical protein CYLTODRAFT_12111 [Cylindrobasidium torrendii FP15055 ss-10]